MLRLGICCLAMSSAGSQSFSESTVLFVQALKENNIPLEHVRICYSPFARTSHTARVVASVLNILFEGPQCKVSYFPFKNIVQCELGIEKYYV